MNPVLNKKENYRLWQSGAFGNKLRAWRTVDEWRESGYDGLVALRTLLSVGGSGPCAYDVSPDQVGRVCDYWRILGVPVASIMVNEMGPRGEILQGEYFNGITIGENGDTLWGDFFYSTTPKPMRDALRLDGTETYGLRADFLIRNAMTPASYEDWQQLLTDYPDHVLEVSIYDRCLGDLPHRNALVWEVRRY